LLRIFIDIVIYLQFRSGEVLLRLFQPDRRLHFILPKIQTNPSVPCSIVDCVPEFLRNQLRTCDRAADDDCMRAEVKRARRLLSDPYSRQASSRRNPLPLFPLPCLPPQSNSPPCTAAFATSP